MWILFITLNSWGRIHSSLQCINSKQCIYFRFFHSLKRSPLLCRRKKSGESEILNLIRKLFKSAFTSAALFISVIFLYLKPNKTHNLLVITGSYTVISVLLYVTNINSFSKTSQIWALILKFSLYLYMYLCLCRYTCKCVELWFPIRSWTSLFHTEKKPCWFATISSLHMEGAALSNKLFNPVCKRCSNIFSSSSCVFIRWLHAPACSVTILWATRKPVLAGFIYSF